ncbi:heavy metal-binding domain-containing protein [Neogemmobacter tilapiae]|uniref:UPF0145 protein GCM10007315_04770 n=1 Tax=Neogemmobacter tilapiae TaxID=875041 RepID=A0A918WFE6_9RHOB|nr:heavy metal-binding domain-containing protein [Gemmobacter tilapiae]GHC46168.1 UPF0145 protein [Gemmobacter tilapiae]
MIITTTNTVEGKTITAYHGLVAGETIMGANVFKDLFAGIRNIVGGRSGTYEQVFKDARAQALSEMESGARALGANAVVGVSINYGAIGASDGMLMVSATGTAVTLG